MLKPQIQLAKNDFAETRVSAKLRGLEGITVKITLIGRPQQIADRGSYCALLMESQKIPALPKGLPVADPTVKTRYVVGVAQKQWRKVSQALVDDPEDALIIEGYPQLNAKNLTVTVFCTGITTKALQRAQRKDVKA
jgi:hypothetical protein